MSFKKLVIAAPFVLAASFSYANNLNINTAKQIVEDYKELRKTCAGAAGDAKKACFHQLNQANDDYKEAKRLLMSQYQSDSGKLNLVSVFN